MLVSMFCMLAALSCHLEILQLMAGILSLLNSMVDSCAFQNREDFIPYTSVVEIRL